jgi:hypothetical protein
MFNDLEEIELQSCVNKFMEIVEHLSNPYTIPIEDLNQSFSYFKSECLSGGIKANLVEQIGKRGIIVGYKQGVMCFFSPEFLANDYKSYYIDIAISGLLVLDTLKSQNQKKHFISGFTQEEFVKSITQSYSINQLYNYLKPNTITAPQLTQYYTSYTSYKDNRLVVIIET